MFKEWIFLFSGCKSISEVKGLENFDTKNVISMSQMFYDYTNLNPINYISRWINENVKYARMMFYGCFTDEDDDKEEEEEKKNEKDEENNKENGIRHMSEYYC